MSSLAGASGAAGEKKTAGSERPWAKREATRGTASVCRSWGSRCPNARRSFRKPCSPREREVFVAELYTKFLSDCGACHTKSQGLGGFKVPDSGHLSR